MLLAELRTVVGRKVRLSAEPLLQFNCNLGLDAGSARAGLQSSDDVEPVKLTIQERVLPIEGRFRGQGQPEVRRVGAQSIPEETRRADSHHSVRQLVDGEGGANHRGIKPEVLLPGTIAHHGDGRRTSCVVSRCDNAPGESAQTKHGKVISGNEFTYKRLSRPACAAAPDAQGWQTSLEGGHLGEFGRVITELLIQGVGVNRPVVLQPSQHAAVVGVTEAVKLLGARDGQAPQHYRVHQSKNCGVSADSEGERDHTHCREPWRLSQAAECIADVTHQIGHSVSPADKYGGKTLLVPIRRGQSDTGYHERGEMSESGWDALSFPPPDFGER